MSQISWKLKHTKSQSHHSFRCKVDGVNSLKRKEDINVATNQIMAISLSNYLTIILPLMCEWVRHTLKDKMNRAKTEREKTKTTGEYKKSVKTSVSVFILISFRQIDSFAQPQLQQLLNYPIVIKILIAINFIRYWIQQNICIALLK